MDAEGGLGLQGPMRWRHALAWFFGGAFLVNALPHFVQGVSGNRFQTPFATPPGEGLSSAALNVVWGSANFLFAWLLLTRVGGFELKDGRHALVAGLGGFLMAMLLARQLARLHGGL